MGKGLRHQKHKIIRGHRKWEWTWRLGMKQGETQKSPQQETSVNAKENRAVEFLIKFIGLLTGAMIAQLIFNLWK